MFYNSGARRRRAFGDLVKMLLNTRAPKAIDDGLIDERGSTIRRWRQVR